MQPITVGVFTDSDYNKTISCLQPTVDTHLCAQTGEDGALLTVLWVRLTILNLFNYSPKSAGAAHENCVTH
jgi:hypothetical protein